METLATFCSNTSKLKAYVSAVSIFVNASTCHGHQLNPHLVSRDFCWLVTCLFTAFVSVSREDCVMLRVAASFVAVTSFVSNNDKRRMWNLFWAPWFSKWFPGTMVKIDFKYSNNYGCSISYFSLNWDHTRNIQSLNRFLWNNNIVGAIYDNFNIMPW